MTEVQSLNTTLAFLLLPHPSELTSLFSHLTRFNQQKFDQNNRGNFQQFDSSQPYKPTGRTMGRRSRNQEKQITNFETKGNELELYHSDTDDELDDLVDCFAKSNLICDNEPEENPDRTVAIYEEEAYDPNYDYFPNCDDQGGFYQVAGVFYEDDIDQEYSANTHLNYDTHPNYETDLNYDADLNQDSAFNKPVRELGYFDSHQQNFEPNSEQPSGSAGFYWDPFATASCSYSDQANTDVDHKPYEEEKLTGLELVPYETEEEQNDRPVRNTGFKPELDYDDLSHFKENILDTDPYEPDDSHDELLENYKKEFRRNFPELFRKKKKRKEKVSLII